MLNSKYTWKRSLETPEGGIHMVNFQMSNMESLVSFFYHIDVFQITSVIGFAFVKIFIERLICTLLASDRIFNF